MHAYPAYTLDDVLRLTVRTYMALRQYVPRLRNIDLADAIRANSLANAKDVQKIVEQLDGPKRKLT